MSNIPVLVLALSLTYFPPKKAKKERYTLFLDWLTDECVYISDSCNDCSLCSHFRCRLLAKALQTILSQLHPEEAVKSEDLSKCSDFLMVITRLRLALTSWIMLDIFAWAFLTTTLWKSSKWGTDGIKFLHFCIIIKHEPCRAITVSRYSTAN